MEKGILDQYMDAAEEMECLKKEIGRLEEKFLKLKDTDYGIVSDIVSRGKRGRKSLGSVRITGINTKEYAKIESRLTIKRISLKQQERKIMELLIEAERYIGEIESIEIQNLLSFRLIEGMTWKQTAQAMNDIYRGKRRYTEDSCRTKYKRFIGCERAAGQPKTGR